MTFWTDTVAPDQFGRWVHFKIGDPSRMPELLAAANAYMDCLPEPGTGIVAAQLSLDPDDPSVLWFDEWGSVADPDPTQFSPARMRFTTLACELSVAGTQIHAYTPLRTVGSFDRSEPARVAQSVDDVLWAAEDCGRLPDGNIDVAGFEAMSDRKYLRVSIPETDTKGLQAVFDWLTAYGFVVDSVVTGAGVVRLVAKCAEQCCVTRV